MAKLGASLKSCLSFCVCWRDEEVPVEDSGVKALESIPGWNILRKREHYGGLFHPEIEAFRS